MHSHHAFTAGSVYIFLSASVLCIAAVPVTRNEQDPNVWYKLGKDAIQQTLQIKQNNRVAKNVVMFLGDGMSIPTLAAARIFKGQLQGRSGEEEFLEFEKFPHVALVKTYNVDRQVPDSAATSTAFLRGVKANYETIGLSAASRFNVCETESAAKVKSIMDWAQEAGKDTGVVTTTTITHATPAGSYAHTVNRDWESDKDMPENVDSCKDIARQLVEDSPGKNLKIIFGGGRQNFFPVDSSGLGKRLDGQNLVDAWQKDKKARNAAHRYVSTRDELNGVDVSKTDYVLGLFATGHLAYESDPSKRLEGEPTLEEMTRKAIEVLNKSAKGFVLLVEGGRIDHAHHDTYARRALVETLAMEKAVKTAMELVDLEETLIIVTADHAHVMTINGYPVRGNDILGLGDVSDIDNLPYTTLMYTTGPGFNFTFTEHGSRNNLTSVNTSQIDYRQATVIAKMKETHGGDDVAVFARGPMAHLFQGLQEQSYVAHVMAYAACIGPYFEDCPRQATDSARIESSNQLVVLISVIIVTLFRCGMS